MGDMLAEEVGVDSVVASRCKADREATPVLVMVCVFSCVKV